jgi:nitrogen fixation protein FixH
MVSTRHKKRIVLRVLGTIFFGVIILVAFWVAVHGWQGLPGMVPNT